MTTATQPTDTEMLDWLIKKEATLFKVAGKYCVFYSTDERCGAGSNPTPRAAIAAEMAKEAK